MLAPEQRSLDKFSATSNLLLLLQLQLQALPLHGTGKTRHGTTKTEGKCRRPLATGQSENKNWHFEPRMHPTHANFATTGSEAHAWTWSAHAASAPAYVCISSFFLLFRKIGQNWATFGKIGQNWDFTFLLSQLHFLIDFNNLEKNCGDCGHNWNKLGAFGQNPANLRQIRGAFGQNWANLRKLGGLLGRIGRKIGAPFTFVLRNCCFQLPTKPSCI